MSIKKGTILKIPITAGSFSLVEVDRETPTLWVSKHDQYKINKETLKIVGSHRFASIATQADFDEVKRESLAYEVKRLDFMSLSLEQLEKIKEIATN